MGVEGLRLHYPELRTELVEDGKVIHCGGKTLKFIDTPMLHWPDSMFTYVGEDKVLFSMDGFGQHYATSKRFNDEVDQDVLFHEAAKYYANIILPFNARVLKTVEKIKDLDIKILATAHGAIWRTDLDKILKCYADWAGNVTKEKVVVVFDTMWGSTQIMAEEIAAGIAAEGVEVQIWRLSNTDRSHVIKEVLDARAVIVGTPTLNNTIFPTVADMTYYLKGLRPTKRIGMAFGSYGWSGGATNAVHDLLKSGGMEMPFEPFQLRYIPQAEDRQRCREIGRQIAQKVKERSK
jgi:flavorubredoxin